MRIADLAPLIEGVPGVRFVALQSDITAEERDALDGAVQCLPGDFDAGPDGFLDTAELIAGPLDLVITTDTAIAHLAGLLGKPVWLMLKSVPDWRWGASGALTPWYRTMRLFRQQTAGDWSAPLAAIRRALAAWAPAGPEMPGSSDPGAGLAHYRAGRHGEAVEAFRADRTHRPRDADLMGLLAMAGLEAGKRSREAALAQADLAIASALLQPDHADAWSKPRRASRQCRTG